MSIVNRPVAQGGRPILISGGVVLTMNAALGQLEPGDVLVKDGKIAEIAPKIAAEEAEVIDASRMIVMPGFVDGHRHLWEGVIRSTLPVQNLGDYFKMVNHGYGFAHRRTTRILARS